MQIQQIFCSLESVVRVKNGGVLFFAWSERRREVNDVQKFD
jgi:hypothetical protein